MKSSGLFIYLSLTLMPLTLFSQQTTIKGFVDVLGSYQQEKVSFGLGEQDLFITSDLTDRISFLGESVFKFGSTSPTFFNVSIERIVVRYNIKGNHNLLIGKHHTPLNYWNDTYHHGRVLFPTIYRPSLFAAGIIPLHTTGISLQGQNLGKVRFGYDVMVGNGIGSSEISDNDKYKSITAAVHIRPKDKLRIGASVYYDMISPGAVSHHTTLDSTDLLTTQMIYTGSLSYFGKRFELLTEGSMVSNKNDSAGMTNSIGFYAYGGVNFAKKFTGYVRYDMLQFGDGDLYFTQSDRFTMLAGLRYQINYLVVVKLEYQYDENDFKIATPAKKSTQMVTAQLAIGF